MKCNRNRNRIGSDKMEAIKIEWYKRFSFENTKTKIPFIKFSNALALRGSGFCYAYIVTFCTYNNKQQQQQQYTTKTMAKT